jgi:outer membrane protein assembly factor BamB
VLAFFGGEGLYCYDLEGELLWGRDLGPMDSGFYMVPGAQWGFASSPILHGDLAIVQCDVQKGSFVAALDATTGEDRWRTPRDDVPTWSTPTVLVREGRSQVICNGFKHPGGYDLHTGEELWSLSGGGDIPVPTPIVSNDLIFITNAHGMLAPIFALDVNISGELSIRPDEEPFMIWGKPRRGNYMQTPLAYGDEVYFCSDAGIVTCFVSATGEEIYRERLGAGRTGFTSSPVAANGNLYYASEEGNVHVVAMGEFKVLSVNSLGEECMATPAISDGAIYYRTRGHVLAVGY